MTSNGNYDYDANADISKDYMERFIFPYMQNVTKFKYNSLFAFRMNDGAEFRIWNGNCLDIRYDINGLDNPPNQQGRDIFIFLLCLNDAERIARFQDKNKVFGGYIGTNMSRTQALNMCKSNSITCSSLIEIDGCEFKKDFPYKF